MIPVLVGLGVLIGGAILVAGWKAVVEWLDKFVKKLKEVWVQVKPLVPAVAAVYGDTFLRERSFSVELCTNCTIKKVKIG